MATKHPHEFKSIIQLVNYFNSEDKCFAYLEEMRWNGKPECPHCEHKTIYRFQDGRRYKCASCRKQFTAKVGSYFEASKLPLQKWFIAIYLLTGHKKGVSSHQIARDLGVTQKTAWFVLQRIRAGLGLDGADTKLEGTVQADETFVGGLNKFRHKNKKVEKSQGRSHKDKTPVMGLLQQNEYQTKIGPRSGKVQNVIAIPSIVRLKVVPSTAPGVIQPIVKERVVHGSIFVSDEWVGYTGLNAIYDHRVVDHGKGLYVNDNGDTSNAMEGFWTGFKQSIKATYMGVSRKHLQKYADCSAFRHNTRLISESARLRVAVQLCGVRLKYKDLIKKAA